MSEKSLPYPRLPGKEHRSNTILTNFENTNEFFAQKRT